MVKRKVIEAIFHYGRRNKDNLICISNYKIQTADKAHPLSGLRTFRKLAEEYHWVRTSEQKPYIFITKDDKEKDVKKNEYVILEGFEKFLKRLYDNYLIKDIAKEAHKK